MKLVTNSAAAAARRGALPRDLDYIAKFDLESGNFGDLLPLFYLFMFAEALSTEHMKCLGVLEGRSGSNDN